VRLPQTLFLKPNDRGWHFYKFIEPDVYRLMCSWATTDAEIDQFVADLLR
jgi:threonine aldolase